MLCARGGSRTLLGRRLTQVAVRKRHSSRLPLQVQPKLILLLPGITLSVCLSQDCKQFMWRCNWLRQRQRWPLAYVFSCQSEMWQLFRAHHQETHLRTREVPQPCHHPRMQSGAYLAQIYVRRLCRCNENVPTPCSGEHTEFRSAVDTEGIQRGCTFCISEGIPAQKSGADPRPRTATRTSSDTLYLRLKR